MDTLGTMRVMNLHLKSARRLLAVAAIIATLVPAGITAAATQPANTKANQRCTKENAERTIKGQSQRCTRNVKGALRWKVSVTSGSPSSANVLQILNVEGVEGNSGYVDRSVFLKVLKNGTTLLGGRFTGSATIGTTTVRENQTFWANPPDFRYGLEDRFLAQISPTFTWSSAERFGGSGPTRYSSVGPIVALSDGSAIVTGRWQGDIRLGSKTMTSRSPHWDHWGRTSNAFFGRLMPDGSWAWSDGFSAAGGSEIRGAIETTDGSILLSGWLRSSDVSHQKGGFVNLSTHEEASNQHFLILISRDGLRLSSRMLPIAVSVRDSASNEGAWVDFSLASSLPDGSTLIVGEYCGIITFGSVVLPTQNKTRGKKNDCGGFVARLRPDFTFDWLNELPLTSPTSDDIRPNSRIDHVAVATNGDLIIQGALSKGEWRFGKSFFKNSGLAYFIARINAQGSWMWGRYVAANGNGFPVLDGLASTPDNGGVVIGNINQPSVILGKLRFSPSGKSDGFVAKVDAAGDWAWVAGTKTKTAKQSEQNTYLHDVAVTQDGTILVAGNMTGTVTFGNTSVASPNWELATFVARLTPSGVWK